jgi:hypothetical protein
MTDTVYTTDFIIYDILRNTDNEILQLCNVKFIDRSVPAEEDNTIYIANVSLSPKTELFDGQIYNTLVSIYVKTKQTDYIKGSRILRTFIQNIKQELKNNPELRSRNISFGNQTFDYGSTYTLKGITLLVYVDEEEEYGLLDAEEISNYCGTSIDDINIK